ncbi:MAG: methylmalonyl Co-A mutase-associated GTPase MeaB [Calditrichota bacterium]
MTDIKLIAEGLKNRNYRSLARAISLVENGDEQADRLLNEIFPAMPPVYRLGITGPPGAGKSTLLARLVRLFREKQQRIGIIAVDPTSPFSGGAVLGDRIRMNELSTDPGVFIRSMATRGSLGGLSGTAQDVADLMAVAGMDLVIFETVGVGQGELDVARATDTTLVVLVPESGDSIQAMKAGLMEIADIFIINKSDRDGAEKLKIELELMLQLRTVAPKWIPPIVKTVANDGTGLDELYRLVQEHSAYIGNSGILKDKRIQRMVEKMQTLVTQDLLENFWNPAREKLLNTCLEKLLDRSLSPRQLLTDLKKLNIQK